MWRLDQQEDGAVVVLVAILMVALIGFGAIVLDVGALFAERRQLQNGADAAALAIIEECARAGVPCDDVNGFAQSMADDYADANANDEASDAVVDLDASQCEVEVVTSTRNSAGTLVPPVLAQVLIEGYTGTTVTARAVAICGGIAQGSGLPLILGPNSWAALEKHTPPAGSLDDSAWDGWTPPTEWEEPAIFFHQNNPDPDAYGAGAFGWLGLDDGEPCKATLNSDGTVHTNTGNDFSCDFANASPQNAAAFRDYVLNNNPHLIPIYSSYGGTGNNLTYQVEGFAVVWITGWKFSGNHYEYNAPCSGNDRCIAGYFFDGVVSPEAVGVGPYNKGAITFALVE